MARPRLRYRGFRLCEKNRWGGAVVRPFYKVQRWPSYSFTIAT